MQIFLIGFMGSGKTAVGESLAGRLNKPFIDSDRVIEEQTGQTITQLFEQKGEAHFRELEKAFVLGLSGDAAIIACGGGLPCFNGLIHELKRRGTVIYLDAAIPELLRNLSSEQLTRPLLNGLSPEELETTIADRLELRKPVYEQAHLRIQTANRSIEAIVTEITERIIRY